MLKMVKHISGNVGFSVNTYSFTSLLESNAHTNDILKPLIVGENGFNSITRFGVAHKQKIIKLSLLQTLECLKHLTVTRIAVVDNFRVNGVSAK